MTSSHSTRAVAAAIVAILVIAAACGSDALPGRSAPASASPGAGSAATSGRPAMSGDPSTALVAAAEQEGGLTTIGLSHDWCDYGEVLKTFTTRYAIAVNELNPDATFDDQIAAIRPTKGTKDSQSPDVPDVIDVGLAFGVQAKKEHLLAPYKVSAWATIPVAARDPDGFWYGDYYGTLAFETNKTAGVKPPAAWSDLLAPAYAQKVALAGDPRLSDQAIETVYAAALANGGSLDNAKPGLDFFAKLQKAGNLLTTIATPDTIDQGATPITIRWSYSAIAHRDRTAGNPDIDVTVPATGRLAGSFVQAINASAPHPNAARLWMEFLYSDEVQNLWLKGRCTPIRFDDLVAREAIPPDVQANLPDVGNPVFPTLTQLSKASALITQGWNAAVGADIH